MTDKESENEQEKKQREEKEKEEKRREREEKKEKETKERQKNLYEKITCYLNDWDLNEVDEIDALQTHRQIKRIEDIDMAWLDYTACIHLYIKDNEDYTATIEKSTLANRLRNFRQIEDEKRTILSLKSKYLKKRKVNVNVFQ